MQNQNSKAFRYLLVFIMLLSRLPAVKCHYTCHLIQQELYIILVFFVEWVGGILCSPLKLSRSEMQVSAAIPFQKNNNILLHLVIGVVRVILQYKTVTLF